MNIKSIIRFSSFAILFAIIVSSCKKNYEAPPVLTDPNIPVNTTIKALKAMHTVSGAFDVINTDITISGVVIANDKSGNLYKELYIQDATGGLSIQLASNGLYANYPVGKRIYIKCKGLCLSDYNNMIQLGVKALINGTFTLEGIPAPIIPNYVISGSLNNPVTPKVVTINDLNNPPGVTTMQHPLLGDLIQLNDMEFIAGDTKRPYADTSYYKKSGDRYIKNCSSPTTLNVRTSGYSDFAGKIPQAGNGNIVAIYTVYNTTKQLIIRDTTDVKFNNPRCFLFEEDFQAYSTTGTTAMSLPGWQNIQESGDVPYTLASFSGNIFPKVSAFTSAVMATTPIKSWLITPPIAIPTGLSPKYTFTCSRRYPAGTFKAMVSTNYTGGNNPQASTWTILTTLSNAPSGAFTPFDTFGPFDFTPYIGKTIYLAFLYEAPAGTSPNSVGTYEPDDLKISKN